MPILAKLVIHNQTVLLKNTTQILRQYPFLTGVLAMIRQSTVDHCSVGRG